MKIFALMVFIFSVKSFAGTSYPVSQEVAEEAFGFLNAKVLELVLVGDAQGEDPVSLLKKYKEPAKPESSIKKSCNISTTGTELSCVLNYGDDTFTESVFFDLVVKQLRSGQILLRKVAGNKEVFVIREQL